MRLYTVDVQTTAFFIFKRLLLDTLQGGSEYRMKSKKELCTNMRLYHEEFVAEVKRKQEFSPPVALLRITFDANIITTIKTEKIYQVFAKIMNDIL